MNTAVESQRCLRRIEQNLRIEELLQDQGVSFSLRLGQNFPRLYDLMKTVYQDRDDLDRVLETLVQTLIDCYRERPERLKKRDSQRLDDPEWYQSEKMVGMACYVDLFAKDLRSLKNRIPYLSELGITYLHLMPLYKSPEGDSDGGYAVSDYRTVDPDLGTMDDLRELAEALSDAGISLVLDFVFNHTSDEHEWAEAARAGDPEYRDFYYLFDNRDLPDAYESTLREIFPQVRRGSFTYLEDVGKWVWTTFNSFQWDLNYSNPRVFCSIVSEMLYLANAGAEVLRLDALAFIWKELGTTCENRPNAHKLIQAFNCCLQIAAPAVVFKSEAIVHPDDVVKYIAPDECQLSYNPLLMALVWNSLATRKTRLLNQSLSHRFAIHPDCAWVNYARCHDDIGWTFDDGDAAAMGLNGYDHRLFLNRYYTGEFEGSFATGLGFQFNPADGDCRVCGSLASLAGLEQALDRGDEHLVDMSVARILLIHAIILSIGGIPLLYAGDELAVLNDYSFLQDDDKRHDARWVNRPKITEEALAEAARQGTPQNRVNTAIRRMIHLRKANPIFGDARTRIVNTGNQHLFVYQRIRPESAGLTAICNFSDHTQVLDGDSLQSIGLAASAVELVTGERVDLSSAGELKLEPFQFMWLLADHEQG